LIEQDAFSQMKTTQRFLYQVENIFETWTSRQWNISWGYFQSRAAVHNLFRVMDPFDDLPESCGPP